MEFLVSQRQKGQAGDVRERQSQLENTVGVVIQFNAGEQIGRAFPIPFAILSVLQLVIES